MARVTSFLLLFTTCILLLASIKEVVAEDVVLDIEGDPVTAGGRYFAVSAIWGAGGGGLSFGKRDGTLTVKQESSDLNNGIPLVFSPWLTKEGLITESKSLTISFGIIGIRNVWQLMHTNDGDYVTIAGRPLATYSGNSLFQIKSASFKNAYKLVYCVEPTVCSDLGISGPERWLELSETPLVLVFIKAHNEVGGTKIIKQLVE